MLLDSYQEIVGFLKDLSWTFPQKEWYEIKKKEVKLLESFMMRMDIVEDSVLIAKSY